MTAGPRKQAGCKGVDVRRTRKVVDVSNNTADDRALVTIPVITGVEIDTGSRSLPSAAALKAKYGPLAADYAASARSSAVESVGPRVEAAREAVGPRVEAAREAALEHVGETRDLIEENLPRLAKAVTAALAAGAAATEEAKHRSSDAALVLRGDATVKRKRSSKGLLGGGALRNVLVATGILGVAAAVAAYLSKRAREQDDPWARPLPDPYVAPQSGRASSVPQSGPYTAGAPLATVAQDSVDADLAAAAPAEPAAPTDPSLTPSVDTSEVDVVDLTNDGMPQADTAQRPDSASADDGDRSDDGDRPQDGAPRG